MAGPKKSMSRVGEKASKDDLNKISDEVFNKGMLPKDAMGLTDQMVEGIYGHAYRLYNAGQYREASQLFRLLVMLNATEPKFILGLAACYHLLGQYDNALMTYSVVEVMNTKDPMPNYHASDCYVKLGLPEFALEQLQVALKKCTDSHEHQILKDRIKMTMTNLTTHKKEEKTPEKKEKDKKAA